MDYKLLIDTNVFLDVIFKREPFFKSSLHVLQLCEQGKIDCAVSAKSLCDIYYFVHNRMHSSEKAYEAINYIRRLMPFAPLFSLDIIMACDLKWNDFEDCLIYLAAKDNQLNGIVTRNVKDFKQSDIKVYSPEYFDKIKC